MIKNNALKLFIGIGVAAGFIACTVTAFYIKGLPYIVSHPKVIKFAEQTAKKYVGADLIIDSPILKTHFTPIIDFNVGKISLTKDNKQLFLLDKFGTTVSLAQIPIKKIIIKKLVANSIYVDVNEIEKLIPKQEGKKQKSEWAAEIDEALLGVRRCEVIYMLNSDTKIHLKGQHIGVNNAEKIKRNVYFQLAADITKKGNIVVVKLNDNKNVYFKDKKFHIENCPISINKSNIFINATADKKQNFNLKLYSNNFNINDIIDFLNTQVIENNVNEVLAYFNDIKGKIDFAFNLTNKTMNGDINVKRLDFKVIPVDNIPIALTKGNIKLDNKEVKINDFEGYTDNNPINKLDFKGTVKDYLKTMDMDIVGNAVARNAFFKNHLSKMIGTPIEMSGSANTKVTLKSKNNIMNIVWFFMLKPDNNIKLGGDFLPFGEQYRMLASEMHLENMILDIKSLNYHMISKEDLEALRAKGEFNKQRSQRQKPIPIFSLKSKVDLAHNNNMKYLEFEIPKPLPSELLNIILKQDLFKKGQIGGKIIVENMDKIPYLNGTLSMDKVIIPSQRLFVKSASLVASKNGLINIQSDGGFRRSKYKLTGAIENKILFPLVVKDLNLSLEQLDAYKLLVDDENNTQETTIATDSGNYEITDSTESFDIGNIIVEKCRFHLDNGSYKDLTFGNLDADLTLDKNSILDVKSNKFSLADGTSSLKVNCDLKNKKYNLALGIRDVESNIISKALLDLDGEISGKASGILSLNTDETLKLNGTMKFIINSGAIEKIGLVEYILKFAALFRNPITMVSPAIFSDILNVPTGEFDKITGTLEIGNNIIKRIKIKSYASQLSTYITGRYNLENGDTSLRIYTRLSNKKKGFGGFLSKISLNALANRIPLSSRNDANYYRVELDELPLINDNDKDCQIFLTRVEGNVEQNNYISSLKKIK